MKEATAKFLEIIRSSSANYALSIHTIFSQTRKIATIPLLKTNTLIQGKCTGNAQMYAVTFFGKKPEEYEREALWAMFTELWKYLGNIQSKVETGCVHFSPCLQTWQCEDDKSPRI
jgi:hypothetical protein